MKKTIIKFSTAATVALTSTLFAAPVFADTVNELESKQTEVQQERKDVKTELSDAEQQIASVLQQIEKLNDEIKKTDKAIEKNQSKLGETKKQITAKETEIKNLEAEITALEKTIEERHEILKDRAVSYQKSGGQISYLEVIFGAQSFGDFISRVSAVNTITDSDSKLMQEQEEDKASVENKKTTVVSTLEDLKGMKVEIEGMLATVKEQKAENETKKDNLKDKEANLVAMTENLEMEASELAQLESQITTDLEIARTPAPQVEVASVEVEEESASSSDSTNDEEVNTSNKETSETKAKQAEPAQAELASRPAASGGISTAMNAGFSHLGTPYVWGGKSPGGFDCSGFVSWAFAQGGISVPSSTSGLQSTGTQVSASNMQPGDIVFFDTYKTNGHVGIYLGGGKFIGAQSSSGLAVANMSSGYWADHFNGHVRSVR